MNLLKAAAVFIAIGVLAPTSGFTTVAFATPKPTFKITRVYHDSPGTDRGGAASLNAERIVIRNASKKTRNLRGWSVRDSSGDRYTFPSTSVGPGKSVTLHTGRGGNSPGHRYWGRTWYAWKNSGDTATLRNTSGKRVDSCKASGSRNWASC
ncbi:lamin tail domain-containing protein [Actinocorallia longicatena]|uniref:Lamin tail domain-containing protein n=1 Tax=Actinocorallia longicatena TaxID=111803 RepID=A0ABP6QDP3_9ACTN